MAVYPNTNRTLISRIVRGDEVAWIEFYQTYEPVVRLLCRKAGVPEAETDDVVQEAMSRFSLHSDKYVYTPGRALFRTYFNRIVRGAISDCFRKKDAAISTDRIPDCAVDYSMNEEELEIWRQSVLEQALHVLSDRVKSSNYLAFTMTYLRNRTVAETARFLGIPESQVYVARNRCIAILKELVKEHSEADPELQLRMPDPHD